MDIDKYLNKVYYDITSPSSYSGANKIWSYVRNREDKPKTLTYKKITKWLADQETHAVHKIPKTIFPREKIITEGIDEMWDCDLLSIADIKQYNNGFTQLFVAIDLFSRFAWVRPMKDKTSKSAASALKDIFLTDNRRCTYLRSDNGGEFLGKAFKSLLAEENIHHIRAFGTFKASYSERFNLTLQNKLYKYFYEHQTLKYIDILQDLVKSYNSTPHSTIGIPPKDINESNEYSIYEKVYMPILDKRSREKLNFLFKVGQYVRVSFTRKPFQRGYKEHFSTEVFKVAAQVPSHPPRYKLVDLQGEVIHGTFYKEELQPVLYDENDDFKVEKIVGYKTLSKKRYAIIRWFGYGPKFDSLVPADKVKKYVSKKAK